jgi:hypothetical protein
MALVGSVITKDMEYNHIYAGSPAQSLSEKIGYQFEPQSLEVKLAKMELYLRESGVEASKIRIVSGVEEIDFQDEYSTWFAVNERKYTKKLSEAEVAFMKYLLPEKAKFVPNLSSFMTAQQQPQHNMINGYGGNNYMMNPQQ